MVVVNYPGLFKIVGHGLIDEPLTVRIKALSESLCFCCQAGKLIGWVKQPKQTATWVGSVLDNFGSSAQSVPGVDMLQGRQIWSDEALCRFCSLCIAVQYCCQTKMGWSHWFQWNPYRNSCLWCIDVAGHIWCVPFVVRSQKLFQLECSLKLHFPLLKCLRVFSCSEIDLQYGCSLRQ